MKFDSTTARTAVLLLALLAVAGEAAAGPRSKTSSTSTSSVDFAFATGTWATNVQVTVNGVSSVELLKKIQNDLATMLPDGMGDSTIANLNSSMNQVYATTCLSSGVAAAMGSPTALFNVMSKMNPLCTFTAGRVTATTQYFSGSCADPMSFTGPVSGKVTIDSTTSWRTSFHGTGQVPDLVLQALGLASGTSVKVVTSSLSKQISATCP